MCGSEDAARRRRDIFEDPHRFVQVLRGGIGVFVDRPRKSFKDVKRMGAVGIPVRPLQARRRPARRCRRKFELVRGARFRTSRRRSEFDTSRNISPPRRSRRAL